MMFTKLAQTAVLVLCVLLIASVANIDISNAATPVSIENAGFENGMDGWTEQEPGAISDIAYSGVHSLKINGSPGRVHQVVNVTPNTEYTLSAYVLGEGQIGVNDLNGLFKNTTFNVSEWTKVTKTFTNNSQTSLQIFAKHHNSSDSVRFDDFSLVTTGASNPTPTPPSCSPTPASLTATDEGLHDGHGPERAVDGDYSDVESRWSSNGDGRWIQFDLGGAGTVSELATAWYKGDQRTAYFDVETSLDASSWTRILTNAQSQGNTSLNTDWVGAVYARYVRIIGHSNSSNSWNSILEVEIKTCGDVPPGPTPTATATPNPGGNPIPSSITDGQLWDLEGDNPHPLVDPYTLEFVPLQAKHTTPNGNGWRHEYKIKSELRVAMSATYEEFQATIKVDMSDGGKTIVAQHHASGLGTIMKLYVADSSESGFYDSSPANGIFDVYVRLRNTNGVEEKHPLGTIQSGDSFTFRVVNDYGYVTVQAFGESFALQVEDDSASYLKFGNYLQSQNPYGSVDCGEPGNSDSFAQCYQDLGITESKITMTNVSYTRITQ